MTTTTKITKTETETNGSTHLHNRTVQSIMRRQRRRRGCLCEYLATSAYLLFQSHRSHRCCKSAPSIVQAESVSSFAPSACSSASELRQFRLTCIGGYFVYFCWLAGWLKYQVVVSIVILNLSTRPHTHTCIHQHIHTNDRQVSVVVVPI